MSDDKQYFYANSVEVAVTLYDINLKFLRTGTGEVPLNLTNSPVAQQMQPKKVDEFSICMSPQHAKSMLPALTSAIAKYEEIYGVIPQQKVGS